MAKESASARFLYNTAAGRLILKGAVQPWVSRAAGAFLSSPLSRPLIPGFVKKNGIDLSECESTDFSCFNDCFTRKLLDDLRPVDMDPAALISPCDGLLSAYRIRDGLVMPVKQSMYSAADLLGEDPQADLVKSFDGGLCLVFRLQVTDYHRYVFFDSGEIIKTYSVPGKLHTVRPIALRSVPVFTENAREITVIDSDNFGRAAQIEVGALMVGRIENRPVHGRAEKGAEKGRFLFGGSTIILLLAKDRAEGLSEALRATEEGAETPVKLGQRIGSVPSAPSALQLS
ncbi:MAG: phosphatidylserine decarboxylase [Firmicutes bacterium]|nr:phosphatidylserine decarboxylase [Bacillota bacterium]